MNLHIPAEELKTLCKKYKVKELSLFGSSLRDDFNEKSDIDLLYTFEKDSENSLFDVVRIKAELETLFGRPIDFVSRSAVEKSRNHIRRDAILQNTYKIYGS